MRPMTKYSLQPEPLQSAARVAVLGTLTEFSQEPLPTDLQLLVDLVQEIHPDLLCLDLSLAEWQSRNFGGLPQEYRDALLLLAESSDIVVVPIGTGEQPEIPMLTGWRGWLARLARSGLGYLQRTTQDPAAMNSGWRHELANWLYDLRVKLAGRDVEQQRMEHIHSLAANIYNVAHLDPGTRILVIVNLQYCHHIRPILRSQKGIEVVAYDQLSAKAL